MDLLIQSILTFMRDPESFNMEYASEVWGKRYAAVALLMTLGLPLVYLATVIVTNIGVLKSKFLSNYPKTVKCYQSCKSNFQKCIKLFSTRKTNEVYIS